VGVAERHRRAAGASVTKPYRRQLQSGGPQSRRVPLRLSIGHEADPREPNQHHRPSGGLGQKSGCSERIRVSEPLSAAHRLIEYEVNICDAGRETTEVYGVIGEAHRA
jgi:hypothetical protein